jgi:hypothetical protein
MKPEEMRLPLTLECGGGWYRTALMLSAVLLFALLFQNLICPVGRSFDSVIVYVELIVAGVGLWDFFNWHRNFAPAHVVINDAVILVTPRNFLNQSMPFSLKKYHRSEFTAMVVAPRLVGLLFQYVPVTIGGVTLIGEVERVTLRLDTPTGMDDVDFARGLSALLNLKQLDVAS